ncbi:Argonaute siRNA chaperone complex subunit Arb1-domain-containing protein [Dichotomocladium elegans]|nr:Argonaute siRNA chaperone complex subunit Arb1-domain-containing protein [Dichotomocladium elegans]
MPDDLAMPMEVASQNKPKKKKKKKKSKKANLPEAGSAMADDYEEKYQEDPIENPYNPERPLAERVEYAIWKYRKNHTFSPSTNRLAIFENYLRFGGITVGPNAYQGGATGGDQDADGEPDNESSKMGNVIVPEEDEDEELEVNFTEVAQVYLGNTFIREGNFIAQEDFVDAPNLVDAFLRYLEIRKVCPEHLEDILRARKIVAKAKEELPRCKSIMMALPGTFNSACGLLFGGTAKDAWAVDTSWMGATMATQNQIELFLSDRFGVSDSDAIALVEPLIPNTKDRTIVEEKENLFVQVTDIESFPADAPATHLVKVTLADRAKRADTLTLRLEKEIVEKMLVGMSLTVTARKLDSGDWFLDHGRMVVPTFYMDDDCMDPDIFFYA